MGVLMKQNDRRVGVVTLGCRVNQYESQGIVEALEGLGFRAAPFDSPCELYIVNTCAVTEESVRKSRQMVRRAHKRNPNALIAVLGCAAQLSPADFSALDGVFFVYGTRNKGALISAVKEVLDGNTPPKNAVVSPEGALEPTAITRFERTRAYVKIQDGCNGKCAYCIIPSLRGRVVLREEKEILNEVQALAAGGCHEVVLTGIETAAYGSALIPLIRSIAAIPAIHRIRLGSLEPSFLTPAFVDAIAAIPKACHHFHLSVQYASDPILRAMRRKYNLPMLNERISYLKATLPDVRLSCDLIVGFPGETEADFEATCDFVKKVGFLHLHLFSYSKRPGTEASSMKDQIPAGVKAERMKRLFDLGEEIKNEQLQKTVAKGEPIEVLLEAENDGWVTGHTSDFIECRIPLPIPTGKKGEILSVLPYGIENGQLLCRPL